MAKKLSPRKRFIKQKMVALDREEEALNKKLKEVKEKRKRAQERLDKIIEHQSALEAKLSANMDAWFRWDSIA